MGIDDASNLQNLQRSPCAAAFAFRAAAWLSRISIVVMVCSFADYHAEYACLSQNGFCLPLSLSLS
jgi:hypothetical protein